MIKNNYGLVFNPQQLKFSRTDAERLIQKLIQSGFIGEEFNIGEYKACLAGESFLKMITFLGCSPQIELTPPTKENWHNFCHIQIQYFEQPVYYKGMSRIRCSCSKCGARIIEKLPYLSDWKPEKQTIECPKCQEILPVEKLNWRQGAGFGQFFITVHNIFPNEAIPSDPLMNELNSFVRDWNYFYYEV